MVNDPTSYEIIRLFRSLNKEERLNVFIKLRDILWEGEAKMPYIIEKKVQPTLTKLYCNCGKEMQRHQEVLCSNPPQYFYYCECGETHADTECYPKIEYKEIEE